MVEFLTSGVGLMVVVGLIIAYLNRRSDKKSVAQFIKLIDKDNQVMQQQIEEFKSKSLLSSKEYEDALKSYNDKYRSRIKPPGSSDH